MVTNTNQPRPLSAKLTRFATHFMTLADHVDKTPIIVTPSGIAQHSRAVEEMQRAAAQLRLMAELVREDDEHDLEGEAWADAAYLTQTRIEAALGIGAAR